MTLKNKINLSIAILLTLIIFLIVFGIWPLFSEIKKKAEEIVSQKQSLVSLENKAENLTKFKIYYQERKSDLEKTEHLFIDPEVPVEFIRFLEKTSRDCQTSIKISPALSTKTPKDPWPSLTFQITSASSFPNFLKFLEKLESSNYLIEIQNLNISRLSEMELKSKEFEQFSLGDVRTTLSLKVYTR